MRQTESTQESRRTFMRACGAVAGASFLGDLSGFARTAAESAETSGAEQFVRFGPSDLYVTRYCQGTAFRSREVQRSDNPLARAILRRCLEVGINFFDSAEAYGWGGSEEVLGRVVAEGGARERVVICTKAAPSGPPKDHPNANKFQLGKTIAFTRENLFRKAEKSLNRLRTDYIDLYLLHQPDNITPFDEVVDSMEALVASGKIRYWGVSNHSATQVSRLHDICQTRDDQTRFVGTEDFYNLTSGERIDPELFREIRTAGLGLLAFSPQDTGILCPGREEEAGKMRMPVIRVLDKVAQELGATRPQVCIAWSLSKPAVTSVLGGAESPEHVAENFGGVSLKLPSEALSDLNNACAKYIESRLERIRQLATESKKQT